MPFPSIWTPEGDETIRSMRAAGHSFGEIGKVLGVTKNSVIGRARRMDIPKPDTAPSMQPPPSHGKGQPRPKREREPTLLAKPEPTWQALRAPPTQPIAPPRDGCAWLDGERHRWVHCGRMLWRGSYCEGHYRRAYVVVCEQVAA